MAIASFDARQSHEAKSLCQCRTLRALAGSSDAASAARVGTLSTRRPDCSAWSPARRVSLVGVSGRELCAGCSHLRAVGWGLVDPELVLPIRFHSRGENFHAGRFSRPLCDCTGTARRVRRPPNFRALPSLLSAPSPICLSLTNFTHPPQPIRLSRPPLARIQRLSAGARLTGARNARNSAKADLLVAPGTSARRLATGHRPPQATHARASRR